jgi:hypothetical protein
MSNKPFIMLTFLLSLLLLTSSPDPDPDLHPFFVSVIEAEYFRKENLVGISCKIFNDDLETALKKESGKAVDVLHGDKTSNLNMMKPFFAKHLQVKINKKLFSFELLGYETEKEATFVYLELKDTGDPLHVEMITDLLYELDKSQVNLIHFIKNGDRQTQKLTFPKTQALFETK